MPRKTTSQWDFGELFPVEPARPVLSVSEITTRIKGLLEKQFGEVSVRGEVSNCRVQASGHAYFTLKDATAQLACVLFRGQVAAARAALRDGQCVVARGELTVYEPRGQYQMIVRTLELQGIGALQAAFEKLKQQLQAEGLFDPARKRPIPRFPARIGLVTSASGAALQDVLHVLGRRYCGLGLILAPCRVQGAGAEREIAAAIEQLNAWSASAPDRRLDVLLVTRGGGSLEDLWAFNEERVARAIVASSIPVVSAVGHEIDFTIADFAADFRAATPSAAAELLTAGYVEARDRVERHGARLWRLAVAGCQRWRSACEALEARLRRAHPRRRVDLQGQHLDEVVAALVERGRRALVARRDRLEDLAARLGRCRPVRRLQNAHVELNRVREALLHAGRAALAHRRDQLERLIEGLNLLSPDRVLARGYSITLDAATGRIVRRVQEVSPGQVLRTRLQDGEVTSVAAPEAPGPKRRRRGRATDDQAYREPAGDGRASAGAAAPDEGAPADQRGGEPDSGGGPGRGGARP